MNTEFQLHENFLGGSATEEATRAAEKMLVDSGRVTSSKDMPIDAKSKGGCDDGKKCFASVKPPFEKFNRFADASEMKIEPVDFPVVTLLPSGDSLTQKGDSQQLRLRDGHSISVNNDGTFAVRDERGIRLRADEILIKPAPGVIPEGQLLGFGDKITAHILNGTITFSTTDGANVDVDRRGFVGINRQDSLLQGPSRR